MAKSATTAKSAQTKTDEYSECRVVLEVLDRVGDKWTVLVVGVLANGPTRFNAIMRSATGISHRMLTLTLRNLERDGLIKRTAYATRPPKVEYELNELGRSLIEPLQVLASWAMQNRSVIEAARVRFDETQDIRAIE